MALVQDKKGGPYSKQEQQKRRDEVYRFHFDYGYSASKISKLMNINRNTISSDVRFWYTKVVSDSEIIDPEYWVMRKIERLEVQRTRIRENLPKMDDFEKYLALEKLLFNIESKILQFQMRLAGSGINVLNSAEKMLNGWLKEKGLSQRYYTIYSLMKVSKTGYGQIEKILEQEKTRLRN